MDNQIISGSTVLNNLPPKIEKPLISFPGKSIADENGFQINEGILSKHVLLLGGSGCGKTNTFLYAIRDIRDRMSDKDVMIVFDTKGEFYDEFHQQGDYVIGNSRRFRDISATWNIFDEILADGWDNSSVSMNAREMASALFHGRGSSSQPFFCNAARDIFRGVLQYFVRQAEQKPELWEKRLNNKDLINILRRFTINNYKRAFSSYSDLHNLITYFGDGESNQALGVFGELNSMLQEYFVGIFEEYNPRKSISMRNAVRNRGGRALFVEYDLSVGETLTPIYRMLIDQALKEALGRNSAQGNVYLIADEFKLLPKLQHIDDALNFGRGLGVRVFAGIQSIDQLYDIYGREKGAVIASGFGSIFAFHTNDNSSRDYITKRFGENIVISEYLNTYKNTMVSQERQGHTVEDWDQTSLGVGQAVIGLGDELPFLFQFDEYQTKREPKCLKTGSMQN